MKRVSIYLAASLLLAPLVVALCCDSLLFASLAVAYGVLLWRSPKFSPKIRKFWFEFWRMNIVAMNMLGGKSS